MQPRVLICDDAVFMRLLVAGALARAGYDIVGEASTGAEAVTRFDELRPDVMTMDLLMPEMGGIDAIRAIRAKHPDARIVVCSAMGQERITQEARKAGAGAFLVKPFKPEAMVAAVAEALASGPKAEAV